MPRFVPENVGLVDYGQNYAARSGGNVGADGGGTDGGGGGDGGSTLGGAGRGVGVGAGRRVLFAFSGYTAPTFEPGCDQAPSFPYLFPRELSIRVPAPVPAFGGGGAAAPRLVVSPVPELNAMRGAHLAKGVTHTGRSTPIARGATIDVIVTCKATTQSTNNAGASSFPTTGRVVVWVLAASSEGGGSAVTVDNAAGNVVAGYRGDETEGEKTGASPTSTSSPPASEYLEIGYDFGQEELYVDHGHIGNATIRQGAPLPQAHALLGVPPPSPSTSSSSSSTSTFTSTSTFPSTSTSSSFELFRVLVDNAMIETFAGGVATASFVSPPGATKPADRGVMFVEATADGLACSVDVWSLALPSVL